MDILIFVIALSILVLVHEFGHYFAAKITGVKVEEFGLGLPPRMFGKKIGETTWSLNWLPIGGFCKLYGEDGDKKGGRAFNNKKPWQKGLIVLGGVLMNIVLAIVIFSTVYSIIGIPTETDKVKIIGVAENSPAMSVGLQEGDWVKEVAGIEISNQDQLIEEMAKFKGSEVNLVVEKQSGEVKDYVVEVRENPPKGEGSTGIVISSTEMVKVPWYQFYKGIRAGFEEAYFWGKIIFSGVSQMVGSLFMGVVPKDVSGPIGMFEATSSIRNNQGFLAVIHFFGIVSVNLAIVNVLPFPALDGGRIIFVIYEMIFRKRANEKFEMVVNNVGMLILLTLLVLITVGDVSRLIRK